MSAIRSPVSQSRRVFVSPRSTGSNAALHLAHISGKVSVWRSTIALAPPLIETANPAFICLSSASQSFLASFLSSVSSSSCFSACRSWCRSHVARRPLRQTPFRRFLQIPPILLFLQHTFCQLLPQLTAFTRVTAILSAMPSVCLQQNINVCFHKFRAHA